MFSKPSSDLSIPKFAGPGKSLKVNSHVRFLEAIGDSLIVTYTGGTSLNDYKPQYEDNDAGFKRFHPDIFEASFPQFIKEEGAPAPAINSLARKILPPRPILPDNPSEKQLSNFKILSDIYED